MIGVAAICAGYAALVWQFGWAGAAVAAAHIGIMLATGWRPK